MVINELKLPVWLFKELEVLANGASVCTPIHKILKEHLAYAKPEEPVKSTRPTLTLKK